MKDPRILFWTIPLATSFFAWIIGKEELFKEPRNWCKGCYECSSYPWLLRMILYFPTCEFCTGGELCLLFLACYRIRFGIETGVVGFFHAWGCLGAVTFLYLSFYGMLRVFINGIKKETEALHKHIQSY